MAMNRTGVNPTDDDGTGTTGTVVNAAWVTALCDAIDAALTSSVAARATNGTQTIATGTATALTFSAETYDTSALHSTSVNTSRMTIPTTGKYSVVGTVTWTGAAGGNQRYIKIRVNGSTDYNFDYDSPNGGINFAQQVSDILSLTAADYVELFVVQDTGGNLDTISASFAIAKLP